MEQGCLLFAVAPSLDNWQRGVLPDCSDPADQEAHRYDTRTQRQSTYPVEAYDSHTDHQSARQIARLTYWQVLEWSLYERQTVLALVNLPLHTQLRADPGLKDEECFYFAWTYLLSASNNVSVRLTWGT